MSQYTFASTQESKRLHISDAISGSHGYSCPYCGCAMIAKKGKIKAHHFAHAPNATCDPWYSHKGDWHINMQNLFPKEYQEVILEVNGEKHIADVCFTKPNGQKLVIEFQNSPMTYDEFVTRTLFWKANGSDMIWVFNLTEKSIYEDPMMSDWSRKLNRAYTAKVSNYDWYGRHNLQYTIMLKKEWECYYWNYPFHTLGQEEIVSVPIIFYIKPVINTYWYYRTVRGDDVSEPFFLLIDKRSSDDLGVLFGKRINSFKKYVDDRCAIYNDLPFVEYNNTIWLKFHNKTQFENDRFFKELERFKLPRCDECAGYYYLDPSDQKVFYEFFLPIMVYLEEEKQIAKRYITNQSFNPELNEWDPTKTKSDLVRLLIQTYGDSNVKIVRKTDST